ncbi:MAG: NAD-dependent epimerase/dehydratase family protein [Halobacteriales archaeon]|nr:NAD-dependent epimerase/dehydratase family protein [Halobacteriales archaeon]
MDLSGARIAVTGGAGFVGSHLADRLVDDNEVVVVDDLTNGDRAWVPDAAELIEGDLTDPSVAAEAITADVDLVVHCAADKAADRDDIAQFRLNNRLTETVVERMDAVGVRKLAFTSSSVVYGEAPRPTPEDQPPAPISVYGASKVAEEALLSVYAHSHGFTTWTFRFANVVGPRLQPGAVIVDFIEKLRADPDRLEVLGDGRQEKSYLHVDDCVDAMTTVIEATDEPVNVYNLGTREATAVDEIAAIVADEMGLDPELEHTGGERGWVGDVPRMQLDVSRLEALGWAADLGSDEAVRRATRELLAERR